MKSIINVEVFSSSKCILGEGGCWHRERGSFFWVDILGRKLFEKNLEGNLSEWKLDCLPSKVFEIVDDSSKVWVLSDKGLLKFSITDGTYNIAHPLESLGEGLRTNDAGIDPSGNLVYGTMYCDPESGKGSIYRLNKYGAVKKLLSDVAIPNTFLWNQDGSYLYSADSLEGTMYRYKYESDTLSDRQVLFTYRKEGRSRSNLVVPDGSALDVDGHIWNASWDGAAINKIDLTGNILQTIPLPVSRPTSCTFGVDGKLLITTASEGLSAKQLLEEPFAGSVLSVDTSSSPGNSAYLNLQ